MFKGEEPTLFGSKVHPYLQWQFFLQELVFLHHCSEQSNMFKAVATHCPLVSLLLFSILKYSNTRECNYFKYNGHNYHGVLIVNCYSQLCPRYQLVTCAPYRIVTLYVHSMCFACKTSPIVLCVFNILVTQFGKVVEPSRGSGSLGQVLKLHSLALLPHHPSFRILDSTWPASFLPSSVPHLPGLLTYLVFHRSLEL